MGGLVALAMPPPARWHFPVDSSPAVAACGVEMPTQVKGSQLPFCFECMVAVLQPLYNAPPRVSAHELYGNPKLSLKKTKRAASPSEPVA